MIKWVLKKDNSFVGWDGDYTNSLYEAQLFHRRCDALKEQQETGEEAVKVNVKAFLC